MKADQTTPKTIDEYIAGCSKDVQETLQKVRATIRKAAPKATEVIHYGMPSFKQHGYLIYFAAAKKHIGLYPSVSDATLKKEAAKYAGPKGNLKFPLNEPIPYGLITKIVKARVKEDAARAAAKAKKHG